MASWSITIAPDGTHPWKHHCDERDTAALPTSVMNSCRFTGQVPRCPRQTTAQQCAGGRFGLCLVTVISGPGRCTFERPLYPRKQTSLKTVAMSAKCQQQKSSAKAWTVCLPAVYGRKPSLPASL